MGQVDFHGRLMTATQTAPNGVVNKDTLFSFRQFGQRVLASYTGGKVQRGVLIGKVDGSKFRFNYAQEDLTGKVQGGLSECKVDILTDGRVRLLEYFDWPGGTGLNTIEEQES